MMYCVEDPVIAHNQTHHHNPPLVDVTKSKIVHPSELKLDNAVAVDVAPAPSEVDTAAEREIDSLLSLDDIFEDTEDDDEFEDGEDEEGDSEEEDEDEDEYDEDEEGEEEDEDEEEEEEPESDSSQPDIPKRVFVHRPSDAEFQDSDLEDRKKRRYLIGAHSFLELNDPHLENALIPAGAEGEDDANLTVEEKEKRSLKDEKNFYRDVCDKLGVKPEPRVLASLRSSIMNLKGMGMNEKEVTAVCMLLEKNQHVEFLNLSGNNVGLNGGLALAELMSKNSKIVGYDLSGTELLEAFEAICASMSENPVVQYLNFSKNELEDIDMQQLKKALFNLTALTTLILNANFIKDEGLRYIGQGLADNQTLELVDLSNNRIMAEKKAAPFFAMCADHPVLKIVNLRRNFITDEGGKSLARILVNKHIEELDASFNLMGEGSAPAIARSLTRQPTRDLKIIQLELQRWYQNHAAAILKPFANEKLEMPIELIDFGMMLDVHKAFLNAKQKALKAHPDVKIIHGQTYGLDHAKGPDHKALVIRKANAVCTSFETTLVMLMEELAKEKKTLTVPQFKKFIKQCNLYKDKTLTEAFENVFAVPPVPGVFSPPEVNAEAILEAFDKEYPGLRVIPEPVDEDEEEEMEEKPKKKKKGKGKGKGKKDKKGKKGGGAKAGGTKAGAAKAGDAKAGGAKGGKGKKGGKKK